MANAARASEQKKKRRLERLQQSGRQGREGARLPKAERERERGAVCINEWQINVEHVWNEQGQAQAARGRGRPRTKHKADDNGKWGLQSTSTQL